MDGFGMKKMTRSASELFITLALPKTISFKVFLFLNEETSLLTTLHV